jgi:creatinine amidohydrolase
VKLGSLTWPEVERRGDAMLLALPLGATEQHGPHLPIATDTRIAIALAEGLAARRADVVVAPALPYGSSGEHADFPGTLSMSHAGLELTVVELVRSADHFAGTVIVSAHGGNAEPLARAVATLDREGRQVLGWSPRPAHSDLHAGRTETSLVLAIDSSLVRIGAAERGDTRSLAELLPELRVQGVRAVSPNGVLGDPAGASARDGRRLLADLTDDLAAAVASWRAAV